VLGGTGVFGFETLNRKREVIVASSQGVFGFETLNRKREVIVASSQGSTKDILQFNRKGLY
jgi:hypothetical protein